MGRNGGKKDPGEMRAFAKYNANGTKVGVYLTPQVNGSYFQVADIKIPPCLDASVPSEFVHTVVEAYNKMLKKSSL